MIRRFMLCVVDEVNASAARDGCGLVRGGLPFAEFPQSGPSFRGLYASKRSTRLLLSGESSLRAV